MANPDQDGFLSRWAKRKAQVRGGVEVAPDPAPLLTEAAVPQAPAALQLRGFAGDASGLDVVEVAAVVPEAPAPATPPGPTMADVALLTRDSDYSRFVGAGVDNGVNQAAMKKLFTDPHFNVMDGLDTYIDDYGKPDPIPLAMLRQMNQSKFLRLFDDDDDDENEGGKATPAAIEAPPPAASVTAPTDTPDTHPPDPIDPIDPTIARDDDPDLRLQQDDAARRPGPDQGAGA